jgi:hypothetical protein
MSKLEYCSETFRPCASQSKSPWFRPFFFLLYFTTCFSLTGHHQMYKVCLRSLFCFPFDVLNASRCFILVTLRHAFLPKHAFDLWLLNIVTCRGLRVTYKTALCIGFIVPYTFTTRDYTQYRAIAIVHTFQFIVTHALEFSVFNSLIQQRIYNSLTATWKHTWSLLFAT